MFKLTFYLKHIKEEKIKEISNSQGKKKRQHISYSSELDFFSFFQYFAKNAFDQKF